MHRISALEVCQRPEVRPLPSVARNERGRNHRLRQGRLQGKRHHRRHVAHLPDKKAEINPETATSADISKALTERNISIISLNTRVNKQGLVTMNTAFEIEGRDELTHIIDKIRTIESVIDIERTRG